MNRKAKHVITAWILFWASVVLAACAAASGVASHHVLAAFFTPLASGFFVASVIEALIADGTK